MFATNNQLVFVRY